MHDQFEAIAQQCTDVLSDALRGQKNVALVDFPQHINAGDHLIFRGTIDALRKMRIEVRYICTENTYDSSVLRSHLPLGPILCQGGGNFGDRWPRFQRFRERVIADFPDRHIVQLPQTIEWHDDHALQRAQEIYRSHPDVTVLMRDRVGERQARELFPSNEVVFCPDFALATVGLSTDRAPTTDAVILKRSDSESDHSESQLREAFPNAPLSDWHPSLPTGSGWAALVIGNNALAGTKMLRSRSNHFQRFLMRAQSDVLLSAAVRRLASGRVIVTDRLHAAILGLLIGRPVVALDNANRKISAIYRDYLHELPGITLCSSVDEVSGAVADLLKT